MMSLYLLTASHQKVSLPTGLLVSLGFSLFAFISSCSSGRHHQIFIHGIIYPQPAFIIYI